MPSDARYTLAEQAFGDEDVLLDRQEPAAWISTDTTWEVER